jgi:MYXO-CTERM domain-containing protein
MINYFQPMPIVGTLSTTVWGASTVGSRDPANGLEDNGTDGGVGPQQETYFYWDGKILYGSDGKYHLYASHWLHSSGFGPPSGGSTGWQKSIPMQAISDAVMGPYVSQGDAYTKNEEGSDEGHNVTALVAPTGTSPYTLSVGEIVPGQMFSATSPNGPWTPLGLTETTTNGHTGCGSTSSNFTFTVGPDNRFWATSRAGCVMDSDQVLGTYTIETDSVLPNLENNDNVNGEDECIWYSGGYFHIVYNYWNVQRAYHLMSKDGITNWTSTGLAYQAAQSPPNSYSNWLRYTDGTVNVWHNMERVGVVVENGHPTHFTFAVTDVNKNATGISQGGSKILVVPFNGVQFDCDNGDQASCDEVSASDGGAEGSTDGGDANDVAAGEGGSSGSDATVSGGPEAGGGGDASGRGDAGGRGDATSGSVDASGGIDGGSMNDVTAPEDGGRSSGADAMASGGADASGGDGGTGALAEDAGGMSGDEVSNQSSGQSGGCGCKTAPRADATPSFPRVGGILLAGAWIRRRRRPNHTDLLG